MNSDKDNMRMRPRLSGKVRLRRWRQLTIGTLVLVLAVMLVSPIAQAKVQSEIASPIYTYLPYVLRYYNPTGRIAFASTRINTREIWVINDDGTSLQQLTNLGGRNDDPVWSPDGSKIAFVSDRNSDNDDIYVMNSDGTDPKRVTTYPGADREPAWSPDGKRIVFTRWLTDAQKPVLFTMNADGSNQSQLTDGWDSQPDWSPDGSKIAFTRYYTTGMHSDTDIFIIDITGTNPVNLTNLPSNESRPAWSPDGKKIAFVSNKNDQYIGQIWMVNADGSGGSTQITHDATDADHPSFSPDGRSIVYSRVENTVTLSINLWIVKVDIADVYRLTNNPTIDASPDW